MSYVQPSGTIQLFRGINLDNRYMHTLYFPNVATQTSFFDGLVDNTLSFVSQSYSRPNRKSVRVKINAESCQDVSYMRFNNRGNKWYYAFVLAINYINENTTDIIYEIDVMQTWFMGGSNPQEVPQDKINPCMVLREHPTTDNFGENIETEPVGSDVYDFDEITPEGMANAFNGYNVVVQFSNPYEAGEDTGLGAGRYDGVVVGGSFFSYDAVEELDDLSAQMEQMLGSWDKQEQKADVLDMYMFPTSYMETPNQNFNINLPTRYDNYTPQNNKLFTYPYSFLFASTNDGDTASYRWEYFEQFLNNPVQPVTIETSACRVGGGSIEMHPKDYNGIENNFDSKLVMSNFPKVSYTYDAYQAFVASGGVSKLNYQSSQIQRRGAVNRTSLYWNAAADTAQSTLSAVSNAVYENYAGAGQAVIGGMQNLGNAYLKNEMLDLNIEEAQKKVNFQFRDAHYQPDIMVGQTNCNLAVGKGFLRFRLYHGHVRDDEMVRIDNFFSVYGYAINNVKIPNMTGRPYWNFVQTKDCNIKGNMPSSSKQAIAKIMDGGIFFWNYQHGNGNIGNFSQNVTSHGQIINKN